MRLPTASFLAILFLFMPVCIHAIEPGDIAIPSIPAPNMDMPVPQASRPNMDMPNTKPTLVSRPSKGLILKSGQDDDLSPNKISESQEHRNDDPMNVSGKWLVEFDGGSDRSLSLTLWPSNQAAKIMGFGTLTEGGMVNSVNAMGSVAKEELSLNINLALPESSNLLYDQCDLELALEGDILSGAYVLRSQGQFLRKGKATAVRQ